MKLLTIETESRLGTLWDQEQCTQFCSKDELSEASKEEEMKIPWKDAKEELPVPEEQYQERFWRRKLDRSELYRHNQRWLQVSREGTKASKSGSSKMKGSGARNALKI